MGLVGVPVLAGAGWLAFSLLVPGVPDVAEVLPSSTDAVVAEETPVLDAAPSAGGGGGAA